MYRKLALGTLISLVCALLAHGCVAPVLPGFPCTESPQCGPGYACKQLRTGCQKRCVLADGPPPTCGSEVNTEPSHEDHPDGQTGPDSPTTRDEPVAPEQAPQERTPPETPDEPPCKEGDTRTCKPDATSQCPATQSCKQQAWGPCKPIAKSAEKCGDNIDNNCDGKIDENCICKDNQTRPCYDARTGCTENNGTYTCNAPCKTGLQTCQSNVWGSCEGQISPKSKDICNSGLDDDCDGKIAVGPDACTWLAASGGPGTYSVRQTILDDDGNLYIIGFFTDTFQLAGTKTQLPSPFEPHAFVAKLDRTGEIKWLRWYGYESPDLKENYLRFQAIARLDQNRLVIAGNFSGPIIERTTSGQKKMPVLTATGLRDMFVIAISPYTGDFLQLLATATGTNKNIPLEGNVLGAMVIRSKGSTIYLAGTFQDKLTWGAFSITSQGSDDIFVVKLDGKGTPQDLKQFGTTGRDSLGSTQSIAVDSQGQLYITGSTNNNDAVQGNYQIKGLPQTHSASGNQGFIAALDSNGKVIWSQVSQGLGRVKGYGVHISASGKNLYLFGVWRGDSKLFDPQGTLYPNKSLSSSWITQYHLPSHTYGWTHIFASPSDVVLSALTTNQAEQIFVTGEFSKFVTNPIKDLTTRGKSDGFVAQFDDKGKINTIVQFGGKDNDRATNINVDQQQQVYVTGHFQTDATLPGYQLQRQNDNYTSFFLWKPDKKSLSPP